LPNQKQELDNENGGGEFDLLSSEKNHSPPLFKKRPYLALENEKPQRVGGLRLKPATGRSRVNMGIFF
jgi:hypothetical protein